MNKDEQKKSVIVIGAGLAGLACARILHDRNIDVKVLEARDRLGGRVWTQQGVETGSQWIHGTEGNPLTNYARQNQIPLLFTGGDTTYIGGWNQIELRRSGGSILSEDEKWKSLLLWDQIQDLMDSICESKINSHEADCPLRKILEEALYCFPQLTNDQRELIRWHANALMRDDFGGDENLSAFHWNSDYEVYGYGDSIPLNGYADIVENLAKGLSIHTNSVVKKIDYSQEDKIYVQTQTQTFSADQVVVTIPLGVLKNGQIIFTPNLPKNKINAIKNLGFAYYSKLILFFSDPFWPRDQYVFGLLSENGLGKPTQIVNLMKTNGVAALSLMIGGGDAKKIESLSDQEVKSWGMQILRSAFGNQIPEPINMLRSNWSRDPFSYGSYSFMAVGSKPSDIISLSEPIEKRLFFAGEATSQHYWATAHGAYMSGVSVASSILQNPSLLPLENYCENRRWRNLMMRVSRLVWMRKKNTEIEKINPILKALKKSEVFSTIHISELTVLSFMFDQRHLIDGEVLCKQGDDANEVYVILSGILVVQIQGKRTKILRTKGSVVGEYGLFAENVRTATLISRGETDILCLDYQRFYQFLSAYPEATIGLLKTTIGQLLLTQAGSRKKKKKTRRSL